MAGVTSRPAFLTPDTVPDEKVCIRFFVPNTVKWQQIFWGALSVLIEEFNWIEHGELTPEEAAAAWTEAYDFTLDAPDGCDVAVGAILWFAVENDPPGYLPCDGGLRFGGDYPELFAVIDDSLKSLGNFFTPDLTDTFIRGTAAKGLPTGGDDEHILTIDEMPRHNHSSEIMVAIGATAPGAPIVVQNNVVGVTGDTGADQPHNNVPAFVGLRAFIRAIP